MTVVLSLGFSIVMWTNADPNSYAGLRICFHFDPFLYNSPKTKDQSKSSRLESAPWGIFDDIREYGTFTHNI